MFHCIIFRAVAPHEVREELQLLDADARLDHGGEEHLVDGLLDRFFVILLFSLCFRSSFNHFWFLLLVIVI